MKYTLTILLLWSSLGFGWPEPLRVLYMAQAGYTPQDVEYRAREFTQATGIEVSLQFEEYESLYSIVSESTGVYDVVLLDNIWTADFASRNLLSPVPEHIQTRIEANVIPEIYNANSYSGKNWAVPFLANFQLLYTNMTMLRRAGFSSPPKTLEEMRSMAKRVKDLSIIEFPIFDSLREEEVLVCELVWLSGIDGTNWENSRGQFVVDRPELRKSVQYLVELQEEGLLNPHSLDSGETFTAEVFIWGDALFTTNWTFVIGELDRSMSLNIKPQPFEVGVSLLPSFEDSDQQVTISGFQGLAVMDSSSQKDRAWEFILFLSSPEFQGRHLEEFPVWTQIWDEEDLIKNDPYFQIKREQVSHAIDRPVHPRYQEISQIIQRWTHLALRGILDVKQAFSQMQAEIDGLGL